MADVAQLPGSRSPWHMALRFGLYFLLCVFAVYYLLPLFVVLSTAFKDLDEIRSGTLLSLPAELNVDAWSFAWSEACVGVSCEGLQPYFWNSVQMAIPAVLISSFLGALTGYALTKFRFKGANVVFAMILFGCFIPFQVVLLPMAQTLGWLHMANTIPGLVLVHIMAGLPFTTLFFRNYYVNIPDDLVKAATIDGAGFFTIFWKIILPLSPPIIVVTIIWQFTQIWNDFLFGASFTTGGGQPVTVALNNVVNTTTGVKRYNVDMAAALIAAAPTLLVYVLAGRYFVRGLTAGSVKG
ncbi:carbohydrate ABC transporter permease [Aestuariispira ectoiniformans]|uniref:carbohydrate ABC transporter permease n=1 Tax=Aestuariispira ectoiniformans TaxID=2775080 RepID=UPI00223BA4AB|nr:carbohydrate ABC transporter permease [Aestuariispira ectoiniformans]